MAWGFAIIVPAAFLIIGVARIAAIIDTAANMRPHTVTSRLAKALGPEYVGVTGLVIPGGRRLHEMILGPFGILVLAIVPPPNITRHVGSRWEIRDDRGRWLPIEAPLDRASRDAERVRGWLASDDRDFVVRVYAAIVTDDKTRRPDARVRRGGARGARRLDRRAAGAAWPQRGAPGAPRRGHRRGRRAELNLRDEPIGLASVAPGCGCWRGRVVGEPGLEPGTGGI